MLNIKEIYKRFEDKKLLSGVSFTAAPGNSIALIGSNGVGKSVLLKIIADKLIPNNGKIDTSGKKVEYMSQEFEGSDEDTIYEFFAGNNITEKHRLLKLFTLLRLNKKLEDKVGTLSNGEKTKLDIIKVYLSKKKIQLLDEPTNNLDLRTSLLFEKFIKTKIKDGFLFLIASHDRSFLEATCNRVIEIQKGGKALIRKGKYEAYLINRQEEKARNNTLFKLYLREKKRLRATSRLLKFGKSNKDASNPRYSQEIKEKDEKEAIKKAITIDCRISKLKRIEKPIEYEPPKFNIPLKTELSEKELLKLKVSFENTDIGYKEITLLEDFSLEIKYGDRLFILGENGVGKTTLFNSLINKNLIKKGSLNIEENISFYQVVQDQKIFLNSEELLVNFLVERHKVDIYEIMEALSRAGFEDENDFNIPVNKLSTGQRMRVFMATISLFNSNFLLLDEPTNHLDLESVEALEYLIDFYPGTILLTSHDRKLLERLNNFSLYKIEDKKLINLGEYENYLKPITEEINKKELATFLNNL